jgi:hypothetical protein
VKAIEVMPVQINRWQYYSIIILMLLLTGVFISGCSCGEAKSPAALKTGTATTETTQKGDPDWWKKQPDLKQEETAINETLAEVRSAFEAKDIEKALICIAPEQREKYKELFSTNPEKLVQMAKDLGNASISFLSENLEFTQDRIAEYKMVVEGITFYIVFVKIENKWYLENF